MKFDPLLLAFIGTVAAAVFLFEWSMLRSFFGGDAVRDRHMKQRLDELKKSVRDATGDSILREGTERASSALWQLVPQWHSLPDLISRAGSNTEPGKVALKMLLLAGAGASLAWLLTRNPIYSVAGLLFGLLPVLLLKIKAVRRLRAFDSQLSEALDIITRALRAGHPFDTAMKLVSEELPDPLAEEFALAYAEINYGLPLKSALHNMLVRMPSQPLKAFVTSVIVQKETGGNLAEILQRIAALIRASYRFQRKLRTLSAEGRMSAMVLASVPFVLAGILGVVSPDLLAGLFTTPMGHTLLQVGGALYVVGFFWVRALVRIDV